MLINKNHYNYDEFYLFFLYIISNIHYITIHLFIIINIIHVYRNKYLNL